MSRAKLKKALSGLSSDQLIELLLELYDIRKEAKEYLEYWTDPDAGKSLEKADKEVHRVFFSSTTNPRRRPSLADLNQIVKHFMTLSLDRETTADFLLRVIETECEWLEHRWRRLSYRSSVMKNLEAARLYLENAFPAEEDNPFSLRFERVNERAHSLFSWH